MEEEEKSESVLFSLLSELEREQLPFDTFLRVRGFEPLRVVI